MHNFVAVRRHVLQFCVSCVAMPHGGGHVGGGGGGFHGGGFHGGGFHHHHHNSAVFVGPSIVWWGYGWRSPYYWEARAWSRFFVAFAIAILIILVVAVVAARYNNFVSASYLSPGDTRLLDPSSTLCESTTLNNPTSTVSATVYLLQKKPELSATNNFTVTSQFPVGYRDHQYWSFYLYPGSTYTLSSCLVSGSIKFYVIKGKSSYDNWVSSPYSSNYNYLLYSSQCGGLNTTKFQQFNSEDEYYFVFYNDVFPMPNVKMTLTFNRVEYMPLSGGVVDSCTAPPTTSCTLTIPYNSDYWVLLETGPPSDGQWDANVDAGTSCNARAWVYVVIVFAPLLGISVIVAVTIAVCCCLKKASGYHPLPTTTATQQSQPTGAIPSAPSPAKEYDQPPPYSGAAPPPYQ